MFRMKKIKFIPIIIISVLVLTIIGITLCVSFSEKDPSKLLSREKVKSIVFLGGAYEEKVLYEFPKDKAEVLLEVIENAEFNGESKEDYSLVKGGSFPLPLRMIMKDGTGHYVSILRFNGSLLRIDDTYYYTDRETLDKLSDIYNECYNQAFGNK